MPKDALATTADEAVRFAGKMKDEVVLKIMSPDILHKSDAGGVMTHLKTEQQIRDAFATIIKNARALLTGGRHPGCPRITHGAKRRGNHHRDEKR